MGLQDMCQYRRDTQELLERKKKLDEIENDIFSVIHDYMDDEGLGVTGDIEILTSRVMKIIREDL